MHGFRTRLIVLEGIALTLWLSGCGGSSGSSIPPIASITSVTVTVSSLSITTAQTAVCSATVNGIGSYSTVVTWSATNGTITSLGVLTPNGVGSSTCTATSTQDSSKFGSASVVVTPVPIAITGVSLVCNPLSLTDAQTTNCTPIVAGTGAYANTVNLAVNPASAGTLSATSGVSSGATIVFTPKETSGTTATITATSTADSTKSANASVTITLRTITISTTSGNVWLANCSALIIQNIQQTGVLDGDTLYDGPYSLVLTSAPNPLTISTSISDNATAELCSPGDYAQYIAGTDGAVSNTHHMPIISPWNMWAGYDSVDEYQAQYGGPICKYKLSDGTQDGACLPTSSAFVTVAGGLANAVDGPSIVVSALQNLGISVYDSATGTKLTSSANRQGDFITDVAAKNGIVAFTQASTNFYTTPTNGEVSFFLETPILFNITCPGPAACSIPIYDFPSVGIAPSAISMSAGCGTPATTASAFIYDQEGTTLYRIDAVQQPQTASVTASSVGSVYLGGFAPASQLNATLARYVVTWDTTCKAAVLAPVVTGSNPDGTKNYNIELALVDGTAGNMHMLGTYLTSEGIPASVIRVAPDPTSVSAIIIAATNESMGTTSLIKVSWTLDASSNPTFSTTILASAPPTGVYGVSLGVLPNGKISVGQRQQHYVLAPQ